MVLNQRLKKRKLQRKSTNSGENFFITVSKSAYERFCGCCMFESLEYDRIVFKSGCDIEKR